MTTQVKPARVVHYPTFTFLEWKGKKERTGVTQGFWGSWKYLKMIGPFNLIRDVRILYSTRGQVSNFARSRCLGGLVFVPD